LVPSNSTRVYDICTTIVTTDADVGSMIPKTSVYVG